MKLTVRQTFATRNGCIKGLLWLVSIGITTACNCLQVSAQSLAHKKDSIQTDSARINHLKQVDIRAAKTDIRNTSPTPVQVLKGEQLQRLNSFSVADALRFFTGVQLKDYGGVGGLKTINVRSLGTNHVAVFYDGVQLGNAQNGQVDLGRFSLDNIDEVDLYNGQKSDIFQAARSFSAANSIYLQSAKPKFAAGEHTHIRFSYKTGSMGLANPSLLWQQKLSNKITSAISAEWVRSDGRYKFRYTNSVYDTTAVRNNGDIDAYRIEAGLKGNTADSAAWDIKGYSYVSERGLPGAIVSNKFNYSQRQWDRDQFIQANYESNIRNRYSFKAIAKYSSNYERYLDPEFVTTTGFQDNRFYQHELYTSIANRYRILPVWETALSADFQMNNLDANLYHFPYPTRYTKLVSLASQLKLRQFNIQASLLATYIDDKVKVFTGAGRKTAYTPTVTAAWRVLNNNDLMFRAFYKNIFRLPTFNDLYYTVIGTTSLRPEYTKQYDAGFTYNHQFKNRSLASFSVQADVYYNQVKDKIVAIPGANLYRWIMYNVGDVHVKGAEINIQSGWNISGELILTAGLNYTYQQAFYKDGGVTFHYNIPYIPYNSGSVTLGADYRKFQFNYSYIYTGLRYNELSNDLNHSNNEVEPWYTHDLSASYLTKIYKRNTKFTIEVNNLLNQDREVISNFPMPRRFYRFKLSYTI
ncbi:Outer membrane cobalamin receptor protein [Mucilaginibacter gossypiicola]|uniref:Outer membrane cobalamin receptor protein n=1 Tax=Mucilaginibacter gossypiicola TaxID=551995 RepID=A0A1H8DRC9_9SPHI|nr:TonB-dependent receptor [Mucilaginibacter gossypiicola]SEN09891.1 Outer membrane cobalamin receptor protein [Mucilaginibacter gossypiicola]